MIESSDDEDEEETKDVKPTLDVKDVKMANTKPRSTAARTPQEPSKATLQVWRNGADDLEPSTKMLAMIEELKVAEEAGDKTICYSQCSSFSCLNSTSY